MSETNDMSCAELGDVAAELALGVLTGRERAAALAHLDHCDSCREEVRQLMEAGGQLLELLPPAEPPAGFETRVLARLGLPVPPPSSPARSRSAWSARPRRTRRVLAAAALSVAVIVAGLGGWGIGAGTSSHPASAAIPITSAKLVTAADQGVGRIYLYSGSDRWLYMSVDLGSGDEQVTCQVIAADGRATTVGSFQLTSGYGGWGSPDPVAAGTAQGARLLSADGTVLATATFARG